MQKHNSKIEFQLQVQNHREFEKELHKSKLNGTLLIVDVFADWVGSCKVITPYFQKYYLESSEACPMSFVCLNSDLTVQSVREERLEKAVHAKSILRRNSSHSIMRAGSKNSLERSSTTMSIEENKNSSNITNDSLSRVSGEVSTTSWQNNSPSNSSASNNSPQKFQTKDDTQRSQWVPLIESLKGKSRPTFLFYKVSDVSEATNFIDIMNDLIDIFKYY